LTPGLVEQLVDGPLTPQAFGDLVTVFSKAVVERAMSGKLNQNLGYVPGADQPAGQANERNGTTAKTVITGLLHCLRKIQLNHSELRNANNRGKFRTTSFYWGTSKPTCINGLR
jgi:transposase-like protein